MLLAAILVVLVVIALRHDLLPAANAAATPGQPQVFGCHIKFTGSGCTWIPIAVDAEGRLLVSMK